GLAAEDAATRDPFRNPHWARDHGAEHAAADLADRDKLVLAAVAGADVVGHLLGGFSAPSSMWTVPRAFLISMFVRPEWRGTGVGSRLVGQFREWAAERGAEQLRVTAYAANEGAIRFYQRHGFTPLEVTFTRVTS
ncbi:MAG TPA: GNAT family N-acetyltransferase, partial [Pseudonocardiaceae bacterium]|nr:GNAT family N-acetyltransferase [Pseudonocardiaceae bacterium]